MQNKSIICSHKDLDQLKSKFKLRIVQANVFVKNGEFYYFNKKNKLRLVIIENKRIFEFNSSNAFMERIR